jgi:sterol desaturase/sphingolipid hydroxylase (fatty acid hydroxylase superfamily)
MQGEVASFERVNQVQSRRVMHGQAQVDFLTTARLHPGERFFGGIMSGALGALALDPTAAALGFSVYVYWNYFIHTNVKLRFPGVLKYVFVSPFMHQWHHARDAEAHGMNVGVVFAWNDWLFKSVYYPSHWPTDFGLADGEQAEVGHNPIRHLLHPFRYWARRYDNWRTRHRAEDRESLAPLP